MTYKYKCECGCVCTYNTDSNYSELPSSIKCFKCKSKVDKPSKVDDTK